VGADDAALCAHQAKTPPMEQIAIVERMLETGHDPDGATLTAPELQDLREHLDSLSPYKPTAYLLAAYAALDRRKPAMSGEAGAVRETSAEKAVQSLIGKERVNDPRTLEDARRQILIALVNGDHPDARPLFERLAAAAPQDPSATGAALRFFAKNGSYDRALSWIETRLLPLLPLLDPRSAQRLIGDVEKAQGGDEGEERWRRNPHAAAIWPELALSLYWYQVQTFGRDDAVSFADAITVIPHADRRARPLVTLALAQDYREDIAEWAVAELRNRDRRLAWEALPKETRDGRDDPALLPLQILLTAWQAGHPAVLTEVYCQSEPRRLLLIRTLGDSGGQLNDWLIGRMAASDLSAEARDLLASAAAKFAVRERRMLDADDRYRDVLVKVLQRQRLPGTGMACPAAAR
jgi:hypothetical protein